MSGHSPPLRLAILGCGAIAGVHAGTLGALGLPVALAFASRDAGRARALASRHGGAVFGGYEEAIASPDVDAVLVTTPPAAHLELVCSALAGGKHAIVEKPAFLGTAQHDVAEAAAADAGRRLLVAENYFYKPLRARLAAFVRGGAVGRPLLLSVDAAKQQPAAGWRADPGVGGGPLLESGIHWVDLMANVGLDVRGAHGIRAGSGAGAAVQGVLASFAYAGGAAGALAFSWEAHAPLRGARLSHLRGTDGTLTFESNGAFVLSRGRRRARAWAPRPREASGFRPMWRDFVGGLRRDEPTAFTAAHARRDLELVERIQASLA